MEGRFEVLHYLMAKKSYVNVARVPRDCRFGIRPLIKFVGIEVPYLPDLSKQLLSFKVWFSRNLEYQNCQDL